MIQKIGASQVYLPDLQVGTTQLNVQIGKLRTQFDIHMKIAANICAHIAAKNPDPFVEGVWKLRYHMGHYHHSFSGFPV